MLVDISNNYGIPAPFLKSQVFLESGFSAAAFRYEPSTIDFQKISGDFGGHDGVFTEGGTDFGKRKAESFPFKYYVLKGRYLFSYPDFARASQRDATLEQERLNAKETQTFTTANSSGTVFHLGVPVKRAEQKIPPSWSAPNANHAVNNFDVTAKRCVTNQGSTTCQTLTLVWNETIWRKIGVNECAKKKNVKLGVMEQTDPKCIEAPQGVLELGAATLTNTQFAINYLNGDVFLNSALNANESLQVTYAPVNVNWDDNSGNPTVVDITTDGTFVADARTDRPDLSKFDHHVYNLRTPLAQFFTDNLNIGAKTTGTVLSGTWSDRHIEFKTGNNLPVTPADPRYSFATSQPYASASYGALQLTLQPWEGNKRLEDVFPVDTRPIFDLLTHWQTGVELGAEYHQASIPLVPSAFKCSGTNCSDTKWKIMWSHIFALYNPDEPRYSVSGNATSKVVNRGSVYEPK